MTTENKIDTQEVIDGTPWLVLLTILLLVGKTVGWWASMSWWWVFSPLWLPFALVFGILLLLAVGGLFFVGIVFLMSLWENR